MQIVQSSAPDEHTCKGVLQAACLQKLAERLLRGLGQLPPQAALKACRGRQRQSHSPEALCAARHCQLTDKCFKKSLLDLQEQHRHATCLPSARGAAASEPRARVTLRCCRLSDEVAL